MKQKNNVALLVIDAQNDFHDIPNSPLPVTGAVKDTERIAKFIERINPGTIFASLDSHYSLDISHCSWWRDSKGNIIKPFTVITSDEIKEGKYVPRVDPVGSLRYVEALETNGEFLHFIWPDHCLIGTPGHAFHPVFFDAINKWMEQDLHWVWYINKGINPRTEHFGIFRANVPNEDVNTQVNQAIFKTLNDHDTIFLAGQARTHCVVNSMKQLLEIAPQLASKLVVLEDCMSNVENAGPPDFYAKVDSMYQDAISKGVRSEKSTNI